MIPQILLLIQRNILRFKSLREFLKLWFVLLHLFFPVIWKYFKKPLKIGFMVSWDLNQLSGKLTDVYGLETLITVVEKFITPSHFFWSLREEERVFPTFADVTLVWEDPASVSIYLIVSEGALNDEDGIVHWTWRVRYLLFFIVKVVTLLLFGAISKFKTIFPIFR